MLAKQVRAAYTQEFKLEAVRFIQKVSLGSWVRQAKVDTIQLGVADGVVSKVTLEQTEINRMHTEVTRLRMEPDKGKKAPAYFAQNVLQGTPGLSK